MEDLLSGLTGYDGSLYREWLLEHPDERSMAERSDDESARLSYHSYTQDTMLIGAVYNLLLSYFSGGKGNPPYVLQPGQKPKSDGVHQSLDLAHATADSMLAFLMKSV